MIVAGDHQGVTRGPFCLFTGTESLFPWMVYFSFVDKYPLKMRVNQSNVLVLGGLLEHVVGFCTANVPKTRPWQKFEASLRIANRRSPFGSLKVTSKDYETQRMLSSCQSSNSNSNYNVP